MDEIWYTVQYAPDDAFDYRVQYWKAIKKELREKIKDILDGKNNNKN